MNLLVSAWQCKDGHTYAAPLHVLKETWFENNQIPEGSFYMKISVERVAILHKKINKCPISIDLIRLTINLLISDRSRNGSRFSGCILRVLGEAKENCTAQKQPPHVSTHLPLWLFEHPFTFMAFLPSRLGYWGMYKYIVRYSGYVQQYTKHESPEPQWK